MEQPNDTAARSCIVVSHLIRMIRWTILSFSILFEFRETPLSSEPLETFSEPSSLTADLVASKPAEPRPADDSASTAALDPLLGAHTPTDTPHHPFAADPVAGIASHTASPSASKIEPVVPEADLTDRTRHADELLTRDKESLGSMGEPVPKLAGVSAAALKEKKARLKPAPLDMSRIHLPPTAVPATTEEPIIK